MKVSFPKTETSVSESFITEQFSLGDPRVIMHILRSKLYSSPIRTICQEVMSNSRDAHREVKSTAAIQITLPTDLEPTIQFRDFGPGITPDRMSDVFIKYGNSTKRSSNLQTGGFGLGAKSPFSYVDSFTVVTNTDESGSMTRREYVAYLDETQLGAMTLVKEEPTTDSRGTTIIVPVKPTDFSKFADSVRDTANYWEVRPTILGKSNFYWENIEYSFRGTDSDWALCGSDDPKVILDGIAYRLQLDQLYGSGNESDLVKFAKCGLRLFVASGKLKVTASREDLDYQPDVIAKLKTLIKKAHIEILKTIDTKWTEATTYLEACRAHSSLSSQYRWVPQAAEWKGLPLIDGLQLYPYSWIKKRVYLRGRGMDKNRHGSSSVNFCDKTALIIDDDTGSPIPANSRLATLWDLYPTAEKIIFVQKTKPTDPSDKSALSRAEEDHKTFEKQTRFSELGFTKLSTVEYKKRISTHSGYKVAKAKLFIGKRPRMTAWNDADIDMEHGKGVFVELHNGAPWVSYGEGDPVEISVEELEQIQTSLDIRIHGVVRRFVPSLGKGWFSLRKKLLSELRILRKNEDVRRLAHETELRATNDLPPKELLKELTDKEGLCAKVLAYVGRAEAVSADVTKYRLLLKHGWPDAYLKLLKRSNEMRKMADKFATTYPLLFSYNNMNWRNKGNIRDMALYVNAKDEFLNAKKGNP